MSVLISIIKVELTKKCIINSPVQISWKYFQQFSICHGCTDSLAASRTNDVNRRLQECMDNNKCSRSYNIVFYMRVLISLSGNIVFYM